MLRHVTRAALCATALIAAAPQPAAAEWQLKPFLGVTFGGATTFIDLEHAAGTANIVYGGNATWLGEVVGLEVDFGHAPGFFQGDAVGQVQVFVLKGFSRFFKEADRFSRITGLHQGVRQADSGCQALRVFIQGRPPFKAGIVPLPSLGVVFG